MSSGTISRIVIIILVPMVLGQQCETTVGSLNHNSHIVNVGHTYILAGYTISCNSTVVAWEFCYRITGGTITFYPGIWRVTEIRGQKNNTDYVLVQSSSITFNPVQVNGTDSCQTISLSTRDQFVAPARSVVGLYFKDHSQLLYTNTNDLITTYRYVGNTTSIMNAMANNNENIHYNIAIRVHLVMSTSDTTIVTPTTSMVSTSDTTTVTPTTLIVSTSVTTIVIPTTLIVTASDTTTVTPTTSIGSTSDTTTVAPTTLIVTTSDTTTVTPTTLIVTTSDTTTVTPTTLIVSTSDTTTVTPTTLIVSTSDATTVTPTISIVSTSDTTAVTPTTLIVTTSDATTVTLITSIVSTSDATTVTPTTSIGSTSDTTTVTPTTSIGSTTKVTTNTSIISTGDTSTATSTSDTNAASIVSTSDTSTVTPTTSIVPTSNATIVASAGAGSGNDNGGGSSIGIIAGAVIGVILCIIVISVIVILLWCFSRRRKAKVYNPQATQNLELVGGKCDMSQESADSHYYSSTENQPNAKCNGDIVYKNVASEYEVLSEPNNYKNVKKSNEMSPYSDSTGKNHSRFASNDYEAAPKLAEYETAIQFYSNTMRESTAYYGSRMSEYSEVADATTINDGEEVYSDPGHCKEDIYACFEKKKFRIIRKNDISIFEELGSGEFGVVHLGLWSDVCSDPVQVAVKTLNSQCSESDRVKFLREAAIMGQFKHNNVVQLHGVVTEEENMMIVLEFMPKGDLREFLIKLKDTTPPETFNELKHDLLSYCRHVSAGLSHLASKGFVHRDLAARNILVSSDDVCKIADFGMARDVTDDTYYVSSGGKVPLKWTAPEAIFYKKYSVQSDVWSFGCVMYEIWSLGYKPFEDLSGTEYVRKIMTGYRLPPPPGCPRAIYELMIKCWHPVANKRIDSCSLNEALQQSNRALLPGTISAKDNEELSTGLGDPLATGSNLYQGLQNTYLGTIKQ